MSEIDFSNVIFEYYRSITIHCLKQDKQFVKFQVDYSPPIHVWVLHKEHMIKEYLGYPVVCWLIQTDMYRGMVTETKIWPPEKKSMWSKIKEWMKNK